MFMTMFDKSFIHGISLDEAVVFDVHFSSNITPLFFVEVLGDLEKGDITDTGSRNLLVKSLAAKTPSYHSYPNVPHIEIAANELLGYVVPMERLPIVGGGRRVQTDSGLGTVFDEPPEMAAKNRWHDGLFEEKEYALAKSWRDMLAANPAAMQNLLGGSANRFSFRDYKAIRKKVDDIIDHSRLTTVRALLANFLPPQAHHRAMKRWKDAGGLSPREFAPYCVHVLSVDLFKILAMGSGNLSIDKTSNYVDLAYLYYLPFCEVFISTDKLHRKTAPLFMDETRQHFLWGDELRPVLAKLAAEYMAHPDIEELGLIGVVGKQIFKPGTIIGDLEQKLRPAKDNSKAEDIAPRLTPEAEQKLVETLKRKIASPPPSRKTDMGEEDQMRAFQRVVSGRRGSFPFLPKKVRDNLK